LSLEGIPELGNGEAKYDTELKRATLYCKYKNVLKVAVTAERERKGTSR
jgi:hypothetical protein